MKLLVFGKTGQVATELARRLPQGVTARFLARDEADQSDPAACAALVADFGGDGVINAAAWTAVDRAESAEEDALLVNGATPTAIAKACAARSLPFVHVSTDYVFDGRGSRPFGPLDPTGPLGAYGRTKLAGEQGIIDSGARSVILRTSWVFSAHGSNFVKTMLRLGRERTHLNVVADQIGGPTPAASIADAIFVAARAMVNGAHPGGIYHFAGGPDVSWADFARAILTRAGLSCEITDIPTDAYPTPARRPSNSRLDCQTLLEDFGIDRPDWAQGLDDVVKELSAHGA